MDPAGPPLPTRRILSQRWSDLTFLHWRVDPALVAGMMPPGVRPELHDGSTWVGLVAFRIVGTAPGRGPRLPYVGTFPETNVRLYSIDETGRRGIVFRSLEASRLPAVLTARLAFHVPYQWAAMTMRGEGAGAGGKMTYATRRRMPGQRPVGGRLEVEIGAAIADPGPLALFLTSRFGLHTSLLRRTCYIPVTHAPLPLHGARLGRFSDTLVAAAGLPGIADRQPDSVLFSPGVRAVFGRPFRVDR